MEVYFHDVADFIEETLSNMRQFTCILLFHILYFLFYFFLVVVEIFEMIFYQLE